MKKIPRKLKKIAKKSVSYSNTEFFNSFQKCKFPNYGIAFYVPRSIKSNRIGRYIIIFGKKARVSYYEGLFDF